MIDSNDFGSTPDGAGQRNRLHYVYVEPGAMRWAIAAAALCFAVVCALAWFR